MVFNSVFDFLKYTWLFIFFFFLLFCIGGGNEAIFFLIISIISFYFSHMPQIISWLNVIQAIFPGRFWFHCQSAVLRSIAPTPFIFCILRLEMRKISKVSTAVLQKQAAKYPLGLSQVGVESMLRQGKVMNNFWKWGYIS